MRKLALCMVVKDEIHRIARCLEPIADLVDQTIIVDTGSTDGTPDLLRHRFGIAVRHGSLDASQCFSQSTARNAAIALADTPWILSLDADERVDRQAIVDFRRAGEETGIDGYFGRWVTHLPGEEPLEDYKLFLFRNGFLHRGEIHENVQLDIRMKGGRASWSEALRVDHCPEPARQTGKAAWYRQRLECAIERDPAWYRYYWFLGYLLFRSGDWDAATGFLTTAAESGSTLFPVECLNSRMVLAEMQAGSGRPGDVRRILEAAADFHAQVADDFEVRVNFRLAPWLRQAANALRRGALGEIRVYRFAS